MQVKLTDYQSKSFSRSVNANSKPFNSQFASVTSSRKNRAWLNSFMAHSTHTIGWFGDEPFPLINTQSNSRTKCTQKAHHKTNTLDKDTDNRTRSSQKRQTAAIHWRADQYWTVSKWILLFITNNQPNTAGLLSITVPMLRVLTTRTVSHLFSSTKIPDFSRMTCWFSRLARTLINSYAEIHTANGLSMSILHKIKF